MSDLERAAYQRIIKKLLRQMKRAAKKLHDPEAVRILREIEAELAELKRESKQAKR